MTSPYIYGLHAVKALLTNPQRKIELLYLSRDRNDEKIKQIEILAREQSIRIERLAIPDLNRQFREIAHQGVVAVVKPLPELNEADLLPLLDAGGASELAAVAGQSHHAITPATARGCWSAS